MQRLDAPEELARLDAGRMRHFLHQLPEAAEAAFERGRAVPLPLARPESILICGMGGSAISGDLLRTQLLPVCDCPIVVHRGDKLPAFANARTLTIVMSYSGNTGETTACLRAALERGVPVVAVSHGGEVTALGAQHGFPVVSVPGGWMPRAALGDLFFALLGLISQLPCCEKSCDVSGACCQAPQVAEATAALRDLRDRLTDDVPTAKNPAKQLALLLHGRTPILVGATATTEAVALRWKCQINENSKQTALLAVLPEMTHNDIVNLTARPHADHAMLVFTDPEDSVFVTRQRGIALELLKPHLGAVELLAGQGDSLLSRQLTAIYLGDYVSVYLAFLYGVDPTPVDTIFSLKARMQATSEEVRA